MGIFLVSPGVQEAVSNGVAAKIQQADQLVLITESARGIHKHLNSIDTSAAKIIQREQPAISFTPCGAARWSSVIPFESCIARLRGPFAGRRLLRSFAPAGIACSPARQNADCPLRKCGPAKGPRSRAMH